jgi:hypothetical protein
MDSSFFLGTPVYEYVLQFCDWWSNESLVTGVNKQ